MITFSLELDTWQSSLRCECLTKGLLDPTGGGVNLAVVDPKVCYRVCILTIWWIGMVTAATGANPFCCPGQMRWRVGSWS